MRSIAAFVCVLGCAACAGLPLQEAVQKEARGMQSALDATGQAVNPAYESSVVVCDAAEGAIVTRAPTSLEQDQKDIAQIRALCDVLFAAFDRIRTAHGQARTVAIEAERLASDESIRKAREALQRVQQEWANVIKQWASAEPALRRGIHGSIP